MRLQEVDSIILSIRGEIELLPDKLGKSRARLREVKKSFEANKVRYEKAGNERKQKEAELEDLQEKIGRLKAKSTEIKTNKEYEAYLKEVQSFEDSKDLIEDEILNIMENLDALEKDVKKEEENLRNTEERFNQEEKVLENEKRELHSKMEKYKAKRQDLVNKTDKELYEKYMSIMKNSGGVAVVQTKNEVCFGCHTNIPPQLYNDIKSGSDIFTCYHCNRFLFYKDEAVSPPHVNGDKEAH
jgi:predicted  nucleic acid-binding Zn-ribbon protein